MGYKVIGENRTLCWSFLLCTPGQSELTCLPSSTQSLLCPIPLPWDWVSASTCHTFPKINSLSDPTLARLARPSHMVINLTVICAGERPGAHPALSPFANENIHFHGAFCKPIYISGVTLHQNLPLELIQPGKNVGGTLPRQWEKCFCASGHIQGPVISVSILTVMQHVCLWTVNLHPGLETSPPCWYLYPTNSYRWSLTEGASRVPKTQWNGPGMSEPDGICLIKSSDFQMSFS